MRLVGLVCALLVVAEGRRSFGSYPSCVDIAGCEPEMLQSKYKQSLSTRYIDESLPPMPVLGLGTAGLGSSGYDIICHALRTGAYRMIDTAQAQEWYDEASVGRALQSCGGDSNSSSATIVVTKIHPRDYEPAAMKTTVLSSISKLYGDSRGSLDIALLHTTVCWKGHCTPEQQRYPWLSAWRNLEDIYSQGLVKAIGVSNVNSEQLLNLIHTAKVRVSVVQNWMDPFNQDIQVRRICEAYDIAYMAFSSFGTQWAARPSANRGSQNPVLTHPDLIEIAMKYGRSVASVVTSWVIQEGAIIIPKASRREHIEENARIFSQSVIVDAMNSEESSQLTLNTFLSRSDMQKIRLLDGTNSK